MRLLPIPLARDHVAQCIRAIDCAMRSLDRSIEREKPGSVYREELIEQQEEYGALRRKLTALSAETTTVEVA